MKCWVCHQATVKNIECRRMPWQSLVWVYKCLTCHAEYIARYTMYAAGNAVVIRQVQPRETTTARLPGTIIHDARDPIKEAEMMGDPILRE